MREDHEKFTPTPNSRKREEIFEDELSYSKNLSDFNKQLLAWGRAHPEPPPELFKKIMVCIRKEKRIKAKRRYVFFSSAAAASLGAFAPVANFFWQELSMSGGFQFLVFILSDFRTVLANWQDFSLAFFESFPSASLMFSLAILFIFLWSIKNLVDIKEQTTNKLINKWRPEFRWKYYCRVNSIALFFYMNNFNKFFESKKFRAALTVIVFFAVLLFAFKAGVFVGYKKAQFSYRWGENYHRNFAGPRKGFFGEFKRGFGDKDFINAHGIFGSIIKIDFSNSISSNQAVLVVKGKDDVERTVLVSDNTTFTNRRDIITLSDIKVDDEIVLIGSPNEKGQIEAKLIRVFSNEDIMMSPRGRY